MKAQFAQNVFKALIKVMMNLLANVNKIIKEVGVINAMDFIENTLIVSYVKMGIFNKIYSLNVIVL
jgi:uncharacterized protein (DUF608 family)